MRAQKGFTIIEISIVLLIIGVFVGANTLGQSLIKSARATKIISVFKQYEIATNSFREVYGYLPGDIANGPTLFSGCSFVGNANNSIGYGTVPDQDDDWDSKMERYSAGAHLSLAKISSEKLDCSGMSGGPGSDTNHDRWRGKNIPQLPDGGALTFTSYLAGTRFDVEHSGQRPWPYCRVALLGGQYAASQSDSKFMGSWLSVVDARILDAKIDDGEATSGVILADNGYKGSQTTPCISQSTTLSNTSNLTRSYNPEAEGEACVIYYCISRTAK